MTNSGPICPSSNHFPRQRDVDGGARGRVDVLDEGDARGLDDLEGPDSCSATR